MHTAYEDDQKRVDFAAAASALKNTIAGDYNMVKAKRNRSLDTEKRKRGNQSLTSVRPVRACENLPVCLVQEQAGRFFHYPFDEACRQPRSALLRVADHALLSARPRKGGYGQAERRGAQTAGMSAFVSRWSGRFCGS